jgi:predicted dehydrogenase
MKLLIIGCGSIGSRHARNAQALGHDVVLCDPNPERLSAGKAGGQYTDYKAALEYEHVHAAVVALPSNLHVEVAQYLVEKRIPIFMEKPLATSRDGLAKLLQTAEEKGVVTMMAQSFRWHEGMLEVKKILDSRVFGKPLSVHYSGGQYLPDWHPGEDYRKEYAAQKSMGGGAMFTSMSHSLDTVEWLFGDIVEYSGEKKRIGNLEIDVDDTASVSCVTAQGVRAEASADFLARPACHRMAVACERGSIKADFAINTVNGKQYAFDPNKRYLDELTYFIALVTRGESDPLLDLAHGAHLVELMTDSRIRDFTA